MSHQLFNTLQEFPTAAGRRGQLYSMHQIEKVGIGPI